MNGQIIYDALATGSDSASVGAGLIFLLAAAGFVYYVRLVARTDHPPQTKNQRTARIWKFVRAHARLLILLACVIGPGLAAVSLSRYAKDRWMVAQGDYATWTGAISGVTAVQVTHPSTQGPRFNNLAGIPPTLHELDRIVVDGRSFVIQCDRPPDTHVGVVGSTGRCLSLPAGSRVRVDYVALSPTQYRSEPLRIWLLAP